MDIGNQIERLEYWNELINHPSLTDKAKAKAFGKVVDICTDIRHIVMEARRELFND